MIRFDNNINNGINYDKFFVIFMRLFFYFYEYFGYVLDVVVLCIWVFFIDFILFFFKNDIFENFD